MPINFSISRKAIKPNAPLASPKACLIALVESTGSDTLVLTHLHGQAVTVRVAPQAGLAPGGQLLLAPDPARLVVFDPKTGQRIGA